MDGRPTPDHEPPKPRIRVGVVDDHPSIVAAVSGAIVATADLILAGSGRTLADAVDLVPRVDVLVCDVQLDGGAEGLRLLEVAREAASPPAVLLLSGFGHTSVVRAAIERGAAGYLDKSVEVAAIIEAIRTIAAGGTVFRAADVGAARNAPRRPSNRELEVIAAVVSGATNGEVAAALGLSEKTIESHLHRLFDRYGVLSRTELAVLAMNEGWVADPRGASR
ncbi:MAG TPA: response regulator transcription factor [Candidatus Limnocylindrales bacterium]|nr:response regulator transcription factor [Candidatus Limnocylindrales bacterium]